MYDINDIYSQAKNGGVAMVPFYTYFITCNSTATIKDVIGTYKRYLRSIDIARAIIIFVVFYVTKYLFAANFIFKVTFSLEKKFVRYTPQTSIYLNFTRILCNASYSPIFLQGI